MFTSNLSEMPRSCGVYRIRSKSTGADYIGASSNVYQRIGSHRSTIERGLTSQNLLDAFPKGSDDVEFELLEKCPFEEIFEREVFWITSLKPTVNDKNIDDWEALDWSKNDKQIADEIGRSIATVYVKRRAMGIPSVPAKQLCAKGRLCCPKCGGSTLRVTDSRRTLHRGIRRRRVCEGCGARMTSYEMLVLDEAPTT
jgi:hypothetical protein